MSMATGTRFSTKASILFVETVVVMGIIPVTERKLQLNNLPRVKRRNTKKADKPEILEKRRQLWNKTKQAT
jgi:hypothetical protein